MASSPQQTLCKQQSCACLSQKVTLSIFALLTLI